MAATNREQERLDALDRYDLLDTREEEAFDKVTRLACRVLHVPMSTVTFIDGHRQWFKSRQGMEARETDRAPALCNYAIKETDDFSRVCEIAQKAERQLMVYFS